MSDDLCDVCGCVPEAITHFYAHNPFIDGRNYDLICWTCACVPKSEYIDENGRLVILHHLDSEHINTVEEMVREESWDRKSAERSVKAIRKLLQSIKFNFESVSDTHIFAQLLFGESCEMIMDL